MTDIDLDLERAEPAGDDAIVAEVRAGVTRAPRTPDAPPRTAYRRAPAH